MNWQLPRLENCNSLCRHCLRTRRSRLPRLPELSEFPFNGAKGLGGRAKLEIHHEPEGIQRVIVVRANVAPNVGRFAVAHEIGHAILLREYGEFARALPKDRRERFADRFASELLIPPHLRDDLRNGFRTLENPLATLQILRPA